MIAILTVAGASNAGHISPDLSGGRLLYFSNRTLYSPPLFFCWEMVTGLKELADSSPIIQSQKEKKKEFLVVLSIKSDTYSELDRNEPMLNSARFVYLASCKGNIITVRRDLYVVITLTSGALSCFLRKHWRPSYWRASVNTIEIISSSLM